MSELIIICMVGAPCSGKSTWIDNHLHTFCTDTGKEAVILLSRDKCREDLYGKRYDYKTLDEKKVTEMYNKQLSIALTCKNSVIILDNTHMRQKTLQDLLSVLKPYLDSGKARFYIKYIVEEYPIMWWRNWVRRIKTGKWIPLKALKNYYNRYAQMDANPFFQKLLKDHEWIIS